MSNEKKTCESCASVCCNLMEHMKCCSNCPMMLMGVGAAMLILALILGAVMVKAIWILLSLGVLGYGGYLFYLLKQQPMADKPKDKPKDE